MAKVGNITHGTCAQADEDGIKHPGAGADLVTPGEVGSMKYALVVDE